MTRVKHSVHIAAIDVTEIKITDSEVKTKYHLLDEKGKSCGTNEIVVRLKLDNDTAEIMANIKQLREAIIKQFRIPGDLMMSGSAGYLPEQD